MLFAMITRFDLVCYQSSSDYFGRVNDDISAQFKQTSRGTVATCWVFMGTTGKFLSAHHNLQQHPCPSSSSEEDAHRIACVLGEPGEGGTPAREASQYNQRRLPGTGHTLQGSHMSFVAHVLLPCSERCEGFGG